MYLYAGSATALKMDLVCRTCLNEANNMKTIFVEDDNDICDILRTISGLDIQALYGFPTKICSVCLNKLRISYEFRQQCKMSHDALVNFTTIQNKGELNSLLNSSNLYSLTVNLDEHYMADNVNETCPTDLDGENLVIVNGKIKDVCKENSSVSANVCILDSTEKLCIVSESDVLDINSEEDHSLPIDVDNQTDQESNSKSDKMKRFNVKENCISCENPNSFLDSGADTINETCSSEVDDENLFIVNRNISDVSEENSSISANVCVMDCAEEICIVSESDVLVINSEEDHSPPIDVDKYNQPDEESNSKNDNMKRCNEEEDFISCEKLKSFLDSGEESEASPVENYLEYRNVHKRQHSNSKPYICDKCYKVFTRKDCLQRHIRNQHSKRRRTSTSPEFCEICKNSFKSLKSLRIHMAITHRTVTDSICTLCNISFESKSSYYRHMKLQHKGIKIHQCDQCDKKFSLIQHLQRHQATHLDVKPYACDQCNKRFTILHSKNLHMQIHSKIKQFQCDQCGMTFIRRDYLRNHRKQHDNKRHLKPVMHKDACRNSAIQA